MFFRAARIFCGRSRNPLPRAALVSPSVHPTIKGESVTVEIERYDMSQTFLLIHGSWHGGWAWDMVVRELATRGYHAHAPTLSGHGPGANRMGITHRDCTEDVVAYIQRHRLQDIILVGHSFGGSVIQKVAERLPNRIRRLIFLDAFVLKDNQSIFDNLPGNYVALFNQLAAASPDNTMLLPWEVWRDNFIQDASEDVARAIWERLSPEPNQVNVDKLDLKIFFELATPKTYIYCRQDKSLPPGYFYPMMTARLGTFDLVEMDGSHEVLFTRPAEVADRMIETSSS